MRLCACTCKYTLFKELLIENEVGMAETYSQFSSFACADETATLSCPAGRNITVTRATYGVTDETYFTCEPCCAPNHIYDCFVDIESLRPNVWGVLVDDCNGQNSCSFLNLVTSTPECGVDEFADSMQVFYLIIGDLHLLIGH